jgi:predicted nucleotidyltransferase/biotin operon repressor
VKIHIPLDKILDSEPKVRILRFLFKTNAEWNGRQIAKEAGISPATAHKALQGLNKEGVLVLRNVGKTHIYALDNESFVVSKMLKPLFVSENKVLDYIFGIIRHRVIRSKIKKNIISIALFGSVSAHKDHPASDVDLIVIINDSKNKAQAEILFEEIDKRVSREFGNAVSAYINNKKEFKENYKKNLPVTLNIAKTHKLVYGLPLEKLL